VRERGVVAPGRQQGGHLGGGARYPEIRLKMVSDIERSCSKRQQHPGTTPRRMESASLGGHVADQSSVAWFVVQVRFSPVFCIVHLRSSSVDAGRAAAKDGAIQAS
jgi:hypothetical protein